MKKLILALPLTLALTACGGAPSVEDIMENPEVAKQVEKECRDLKNAGKSTDTEACRNLRAAYEKLATDMLSSMFGGKK